MQFEIFTDSSANLTQAQIDANQICILPSCEDFYEQFFRKKLENGHNILYIGFSSALGNTFTVAESVLIRLKKEYSERKTFAVDSLSGSMGEGLLVLKAAQMRENDATIEEIRQWVEENKLQVCQYGTVEDLYYLFRGGRIKRSNYLISNIIKFKPILHIDGYGRLLPLCKVISRKKSISSLAAKVSETIILPQEQTVFITHGDCYDDAILLKNRLIELLPNVREIKLQPLDAVLGAHTGPGALGIFFLGGHR